MGGEEPAVEPNRRFPRIPIENPVLVRRAEGDPGAFSTAKSLGGGGCMFHQREPLAVGDHLVVTISVRGGFIEAPAKVVYATPADGGFDVGVEFLALSELDRAALDELLAPPRP